MKRIIATLKHLNQGWVRKLLQYIILFSILFFISLTFYQNWSKIADHNWQIDYTLMAASILMIVLTMLFGATIWGHMLTHFSQKTSLTQLMAIWLKSQLAKYIPGNFWNLVGRAYLCRQREIPSSGIFLSIYLELVLNLIAQLIIIIVFGFITLDFLQDQSILFFFSVAILLGIIATHPRILSIFISFLAHLSNKNIEMPKIKQIKIIGYLGLYIISMTLGGITFFIFINSIYSLSLIMLPQIIAIVTIAYVIGFLSPISPNGLGVREGVFTLLLSQFMPVHIAVTIALAARVWLIIGEMLGGGFGVLLDYHINKYKSPVLN